MTRHGSHTESRMRENCTYGSMRGRAYPTTRGAPLYSTPFSPPSINCLGRRVASYTTRDAKEIAKLSAMVP